MKLKGILGTGTGKLGSSVFSTVAGQQVVRQYQPVVANPNTEAQVTQRSKFKLASQLASVMAPAITFPRNGMRSSRNEFVKANFPFIYLNNDGAKISLENVQLTNGRNGLPMIEGSRSVDGVMMVKLAEAAGPTVSRVVYVIFKRNSEYDLEMLKSVIVEPEGDDRTFQTEVDGTNGDIIVYAYGMKDLSESATAKYGNMKIADGVQLAALAANRQLSAKDFAFTQTRGASMTATESQFNSIPTGNYRVFLSISGDHEYTWIESILVDGVEVRHTEVDQYGHPIFELAPYYPEGTRLQIGATTTDGHSDWDGWSFQGSEEFITTSEVLNITVNGTLDLVGESHTVSSGVVVEQP